MFPGKNRLWKTIRKHISRLITWLIKLPSHSILSLTFSRPNNPVLWPHNIFSCWSLFNGIATGIECLLNYVHAKQKWNTFPFQFPKHIHILVLSLELLLKSWHTVAVGPRVVHPCIEKEERGNKFYWSQRSILCPVHSCCIVSRWSSSAWCV